MAGIHLNMRKIQISIRSVLVFGFGGLLISALAITILLGFATATKNTYSLLASAAESAVDNAEQIILNDLEKYENQASWVGEALATGHITLDDTDGLEKFLVGSMAATADIAGMAIIDQKGSVYSMTKNFPILRIENYTQSYHEISRVQKQLNSGFGSIWDRPFWHPELQRTLVNLRSILGIGNNERVMFAQGVSIESLSELLLAADSWEGATPFMIYDYKYVLAHPNLALGVFKSTENQTLPTMDQVNDPMLGYFSSSVDAQWDEIGNTDIQASVNWIEGDEHFYLYRELPNLMDKPIIIGIHVSENDSSTEMDRLIRSAIIACITVVVAIIILLIMSQRLQRPITRLADASLRIGENKLNEPLQLPDSSILEYDQAAKAFNGMVQGLQEREKIRGLFGKMVPERVAEAMLKSQGTLTPQNVEGTVLFCDLEGFTSLSEKLEPQTIVELLNNFFTDMVEVIEFHGGIITQFQGDAILAVFNVPIEDPDHAAHAIQAGNAMLNIVNNKRYLGHSLRCRIGINTGTMVAGNVGAESRMNYTVHGDAVNTAARLENMNKQFGSHILISETTKALAPDFNYKKLGEADIRGKEQPVSLYTMSETIPEVSK
ncbi:adenylate/guanylate cyclase domain-containing protein [Rhodospirillaceae bacterium RKSG073]|nr:adenylate/guanylate cyclase domain-containing protein [Curvivirga aplysinae]